MGQGVRGANRGDVGQVTKGFGQGAFGPATRALPLTWTAVSKQA